MSKILPSAKDALNRSIYNKESKAKIQMIDIINHIEKAIEEGCTKCNYHGTILQEIILLLEKEAYVLKIILSGYNENATEISWNLNAKMR